jgi:hypothetical protein
VDRYAEVTNWFHAVSDDYRSRVQDHIWLCGAANWEQDTINDELLISQKQLDQKVQTWVVKHAECDRLMLHASQYIFIYTDRNLWQRQEQARLALAQQSIESGSARGGVINRNSRKQREAAGMHSNIISL